MTECVLFDFDDTLTRRDTTRFWLKAFARIYPFKVARNVQHVLALYKAKRRGGGIQEAKLQMISSMLHGLSPEDLAPVHKAYAREVRRNLRAIAWCALESHLEAGRHVIVVTASPRNAVESVFAGTGVETLGTEFAIENGRFTGELLGCGCYSAEKKMVIDAWLTTKTEPVAFVEAWSDSLSDVVMLSFAERRCWICPPANPSEILAIDPDGVIIDGGQ